MPYKPIEDITGANSAIADIYGRADAALKALADIGWDTLAGKPDTFLPSAHTHSYLPLSGGALTSQLTINHGNNALIIKPGTTDMAYMGLYARTTTPNTRSAWFGFGSTGSTLLTFSNDIPGGNLRLSPGSGGVAQVDGNTIWHAGNLTPADYATEKGTWTPTLTDASGHTATLSGAWGIYETNQNNVHVLGRVQLSSITGLVTGERVQIGGLPYTASFNAYPDASFAPLGSVVIGGVTWPADAKQVCVWVPRSQTFATLQWIRSAAGLANFTCGALSATAAISIDAWYRR